MRLARVLPGLALALLLPLAAASAQDMDGRDAQVWLARTRLAAERLDYAGTFTYQQGSESTNSRITHLGKGKKTREKLEILGSPPREYIRNGDEIIAYLPAARRLVVEGQAAGEKFPALLASSPGQLVRHYRIRKAGLATVAGRDAQAIALDPLDGLRFGYRLWIDRASGLLLRAQTLSEKGEVVEQIAFTAVTIGNVAPARVTPSYPDTRGWRIENALTKPLELSGWAVKWVPGGFARIASVRRTIPDYAQGGGRDGQARSLREVTQLVYSDGLAGISVFIEPWSPQRSGAPVQQGALNMVGKRHGDFWLTIVGEVPMAAIRQVADSIELNETR